MKAKTTVRLPGGKTVEATFEDIDLDKEVVLNADGTRYTEADAQADADFFEAKARERGRGKPSLSGHGISPQIGVRLPADLRQKLAARANADGVRESDIVRDALTAYLAVPA